MDLRQQYYHELALIKDARIAQVIEVAKQVFDESTIHQTNIKTIAKRAKIGEATFYRYFGDKVTLVKLVSLSYWEELTKLFYQYYTDHIKNKATGYLKIEAFLQIFTILYEDHRPFIHFTDDYDNYMRDKDKHEGSFEALQISIKEMFIDLYNLARADQSIRQDIDASMAYDLMAQMFISILQRMTLRAGKLRIEQGVSIKRSLPHYIRMFMNYLTAEGHS